MQFLHKIPQSSRRMIFSLLDVFNQILARPYTYRRCIFRRRFGFLRYPVARL